MGEWYRYVGELEAISLSLIKLLGYSEVLPQRRTQTRQNHLIRSIKTDDKNEKLLGVKNSIDKLIGVLNMDIGARTVVR